MSAPQVGTRRERRQAQLAARRETRHHPRATSARIGLGRLSAIGVLGGMALIAIAIAFGAAPGGPVDGTTSVSVGGVPSGLVTEGFTIGDPAAPVTIDLYEDFQCPACLAWSQEVFPGLAANELDAGVARIVFHDMAFLGPESVDAGRAAFAAAQQGRFWDMWATLYLNQGRENSGAFDHDRLVGMASGLGLDVTRFEADMGSAAATRSLDRSRADASATGVDSTPTLVIDGTVHAGLGSYAEVASAVAAAAAR